MPGMTRMRGKPRIHGKQLRTMQVPGSPGTAFPDAPMRSEPRVNPKRLRTM